MTRKERIAWAAGLFEGEGCITGSRGKTDIHASLVMSDEDTVERFASIMGCGAVRQETIERPAHHKPMWRWQAHGNNAEAVMQLLLPYLGIRRTARAKELLLRRDEWRRRSRSERSCPVCHSAFCPAWAGPTASQQIYCSRQCGQRAAELDHRLRGRTKRIETGTYVPPNGRKTHCVNGHEFTAENTRMTPHGARACRACVRERKRRSYPMWRDAFNATRRARRAARVESRS